MWLRRLRGIAGTALVWAVVWTIGWNVLAAIIFLVVRPNISVDVQGGTVGLLRGILAASLAWALWGAISGSLFAIITAIAERRRSIGDLRMRRVAAWGAIGAAALPTVMAGMIAVDSPLREFPWFFGIILLVSALLGAVCSSGSLWLARHVGEAAVTSRT